MKTIQVGQTFTTESNEFTVIEVNGRHARVRMAKPNFRHLTKKEGGPRTVPVWETEFHVNTLADMDAK